MFCVGSSGGKGCNRAGLRVGLLLCRERGFGGQLV